MQYVVIRSTKKDSSGELVSCSISAPLVPGKRLVWNKANDFTCKVPVVLSYINSWGEEQVLSKNWAQEILNNYKDEFGLELVEIIESPVVVQPEAVVKRGPGRPKKQEKEKEDETSVV